MNALKVLDTTDGYVYVVLGICDNTFILGNVKTGEILQIGRRIFISDFKYIEEANIPTEEVSHEDLY